MLIRKMINKIRNIDKIAELKHELNSKDKIIRCYQRGNDTLKSEIEQLTKDDLVRILVEPKNAIIKQYKELLSLDNIELEINSDVLNYIAETCLENKTGARGLRSVIEDIMENIMYEAPDKDNLVKVIDNMCYILSNRSDDIGYNGYTEYQNSLESF